MSTPHAIRNGIAHHPASDSDLEFLNVDDRLQEEMQQLAAINQELLGKIDPVSRESSASPEKPNELAGLRKENSELRARIEELEQVALGASPTEETWAERQKEYEALLEEKSEVIRTMHLKIQELQVSSPSPSEQVADNSECQRLKKEMAEQRRQLEEDEITLMDQMRQMEMAMSKDRAELARQRNEIQRLHNELNHEIEIASRDPGLRERLVALQRLQGEITGRKSPNTPLPASLHPNEASPAAATSGKKKQNSGLLRRIFGK